MRRILSTISAGDEIFFTMFRTLAKCIRQYLLHYASKTNSFWNPATKVYKSLFSVYFTLGCSSCPLTMTLFHVHLSQNIRRRSSLSLMLIFLRKKWRWLNHTWLTASDMTCVTLFTFHWWKQSHRQSGIIEPRSLFSKGSHCSSHGNT